MCDVISQSQPVARRDYDCMASDWLQNDLRDYVELCTFAEKREIVKARRAKWKILKGQRYIRQAMKDGDVYTFRAIPAIHKICLRLDVYDC